MIHIQAFIALSLLTGLLVWGSSDRLEVRRWRRDLEDNPYPETWEDQ